MTTNRFVLSCACCAFLAAGPASAQNTGGVFGPVVNEGDRQVQYRITFDPDSDGLAQRIHYEQALNGDFMLRGVVQARKTTDSDLDFDYFQGELFWELSRDGASWRTGLRLDARIRDGDRPETIGLNWMNHWNLAGSFSARFLVLSSVDIGDNARDGVFLQTRASLYRKLGKGPRLGLELYNSYGSTDGFADFDDQRHQLGPAANFSLGAGRSLFTNVLFGLTDATPDAELRLWFSMKL